LQNPASKYVEYGVMPSPYKSGLFPLGPGRPDPTRSS